MAFTLPYPKSASGNYTDYQSLLADSNNEVTIWRKELARESQKQMQFNPFMGESAKNVIQHFRELEGQHGTTIRKSLMKRIPGSNAPYQGDYDTHGKEVKLQDSSDSVSLVEWRLPAMEGRAERQKPVWNYSDETKFAIQNYVKERKDLHVYNSMIGVDSNDGLDAAMYSGETPTNIVYPEGVTSVADITPSHILNVETAPRAAEILETGYSDSSTQVWVGMPPDIGGESVRGVFFISPYSKYDLRYDDDLRFEGWLQNARERSAENPIWKGIRDKFVVDDILYVTLRYPLDQSMIYTTSVLGATPGCQIAINVYCTAQALLRATAIEDILDFEDWDGKQFKRVIGGSFEGITKTRFGRADSNATQKDWGVVVCPTAAYHHND